MKSAYTIVVPDTDILTCLCGTNDSNLRLIENYLGVPVFTHGNELSIGDADSDIQEKFKFIIDRILDESAAGEQISPDLVRSVLQYESHDSSEMLASAVIKIPGAVTTVFPKTVNQAEFILSMRSNDVVLCAGPAGSGKTYLAVAEALRQLFSGAVNKLVLTRPVVEAGENLGFLPGDLEQKISPYLRPLFDSVEKLMPKGVSAKLTEAGVIELAPLAYMRGRTLDSCILILDEAQNTTKEQMKLFLTRLGQGSKVFVTGDITQIDLPRRIPSGFVHALEILNRVEGVKIMHLDEDDIVRNPLVKRIVQAYENDKDEK